MTISNLAVRILIAILLAGIVTFPLWARFLNSPSEQSNANLADPAFNTTPITLNQPIHPIVTPSNLDQKKVSLGEMLFHEKQLSLNNSVSCASCHNLEAGGADNLPRSIGTNGLSGELNSPTVFNASFNIAQYWDGRAESLNEQIDGPIHNPVEMGSSWSVIIQKLQSSNDYARLFQELYDDGITIGNIKESIVSFEQSLVTIDSPFDLYLLGDEHAISESAKAGYEKFKEYGCIACHQGRNVGGNLYQRLGIMGDYFADRGTAIRPSDLGRYNVTGLEEDKHVFKVPSLRLAALTSPYFHDGSVGTLNEAVRLMIKFQTGRVVSEEDENLIVEFINSLVGYYKGQRLTL